MYPLSQFDAMKLVEQVLSVPGVSSMHRGEFGEIALLFPGQRVPGVRCTDQGVEVHVVAKRDAGNLHDLGSGIRARASIPVQVIIGDIE